MRFYLEAPRQKLVLHLQEVALVGLGLEGLVDDGELGVVLDVLPACVPVAGAWQSRIVFTAFVSDVCIINRDVIRPKMALHTSRTAYLSTFQTVPLGVF